MSTRKTPRFPRIIRLFDAIFAADPGPKAFWILSWMGCGFLLLFIVPPQLLNRAMPMLMLSAGADDGGYGFKIDLSMAIGFVLLATFYAGFYYWVFAAGIPRKRQGLGTEYNPVKFASMADKLREIRFWQDADDWRKFAARKNAKAVQAYEAWLAAADADSYKAWRAYRVEQGV
jgi:hypothetical protein